MDKFSACDIDSERIFNNLPSDTNEADTFSASQTFLINFILFLPPAFVHHTAIIIS